MQAITHLFVSVAQETFLMSKDARNCVSISVILLEFDGDIQRHLMTKA